MGRGAAGRRTRPLAILAVAVVVSACRGGPPPADAGDVPASPTAAATDVDVCGLAPAETVSDIIDLDVAVVAASYGPARLTTYACSLGVEFGVPQVTTELAIGPVSANVFESAYGDAAGGDPTLVAGLGDRAFLRTEQDERSLRVLVHGSILSLQVRVDAANPVARRTVIELARLAVTNLPASPRIAPTSAGQDCSAMPLTAAAAAIGAAPKLASHVSGPDGSFMCSWASRPGSVVLTVLRAPSRITAYRRNLDPSLYLPVDAAATRPGSMVVSRIDRAGDLLIFHGRSALAIVTVVPSAGFSDSAIPTTPGEVAVAKAVLLHLL